MITMFLLEKCKSPNFWTCHNLIYVSIFMQKKELELSILIPRVCGPDRRQGGEIKRQKSDGYDIKTIFSNVKMWRLLKDD